MLADRTSSCYLLTIWRLCFFLGIFFRISKRFESRIRVNYVKWLLVLKAGDTFLIGYEPSVHVLCQRLARYMFLAVIRSADHWKHWLCHILQMEGASIFESECKHHLSILFIYMIRVHCITKMIWTLWTQFRVCSYLCGIAENNVKWTNINCYLNNVWHTSVFPV